ncbi:type 2 lantibiotic biosynthesis protein LanM [Kitasatospora sp. MAA4]|uniref:type 2 lanthipeptide synthetase LanM family protein n=1 Tax=Kitasatospora sp. MAA4 TaxID=3035093 RepID=UPI002473D252|nr:type 2 lanthipeptide synthetase LanM family protein [Kitasatospora sp. MAA4]MDH6136917.1 type 2 lantibiotic biosynthesis protein LanM [Kitasatospora sp. MAA4]
MITSSLRSTTGPPPAAAWWSRGLSAAERPGDLRPDWAAFVDEVLATSATPVVPPGELRGTAWFRTVVTPFAELAATRLVTPGAPARVDLAAVRALFVHQLAESLARQAARTLVLELNVARVNGRLLGDTPSKRFRHFLALAASREGLRALCHEYPVLARLLARTSLAAAEALTELLARFAADRADLVAALLSGAEPGALTAVRTAGDGHRRGRSVAVLHFAGGDRVVYKPRSLRAHRHFTELVGWFNEQPGTPGLRTPALLDRPGYGWVEFVAPQPCVSPEQVERFYLRQGAWLALLHALDGTDLHFENLVACADHPVLVDVETLFHPPAPAGRDQAEQDPAALVLESSVQRTALLPRPVLGDLAALDVSGLGGDPGALFPNDVVAWAADGTDEMRLVRQAGELAGAGNRPRLDGVDADPVQHTEALVAGFRTGCRAITAGWVDLAGPHGLLHRFAEDEVRVITRATQAYGTLLDESTHPDVLRDGVERDGLLRLLETDVLGQGRPGLVEDEIAELWDGDVPLFTTRPGATDLWTGTGRRMSGALDRPGLARVADKIRAMGPADLDEQEWIIRASLATRSTAPAHDTGEPLPEPSGPAAGPAPDSGRLLAAARAIGDQLVDRAHLGPQRANWLGLHLLGDRCWRLAPAGAELGGGYPGPALFLAQLAALTGAARYAEVARRALRPVPRLLDRLAARPDELGAVGSGAFAGLGGLLHALTQVAVLLDDREVRDWLEPATALTVAAAEAEDSSGVADGTAGGLVALLGVHQATGSAQAWRGARDCAARLLDRPLPAAPGFTAGAAGVGWALLRFAAAGGDARYERAGLAALRSAARAADGLSWCAGLPGVALAVTDSTVAAADPELAALVERAARAVVTGGRLPNHSLCHGELGALELLGRATGPAERAARDHRAAALLATLARTGPRCGTPGHLASPGLLNGLAGIGHGLLRLGFADTTTSALLLRLPSNERPASRRPLPLGEFDPSEKETQRHGRAEQG